MHTMHGHIHTCAHSAALQGSTALTDCGGGQVVAERLFGLSWVSGRWEVAGELYRYVLFQPTNNMQHISKLPHCTPSP